jgi:hypothetical protein
VSSHQNAQRRRSLEPSEHKPPHRWSAQRRSVWPPDRRDSHQETAGAIRRSDRTAK